MSQCDVTSEKSTHKRPKQRLGGGCAMGTYLVLNCTYLVSNCTYCCKLSFNIVPTGEDHCDICLAGVWLHKERFLRTSSIVIATLRTLVVKIRLHSSVAPSACACQIDRMARSDRCLSWMHITLPPLLPSGMTMETTPSVLPCLI